MTSPNNVIIYGYTAKYKVYFTRVIARVFRCFKENLQKLSFSSKMFGFRKGCSKIIHFSKTIVRTLIYS